MIRAHLTVFVALVVSWSPAPAVCLDELYKLDRIGTGIELQTYLSRACSASIVQNQSLYRRMEDAENFVRSRKVGKSYAADEARKGLTKAYEYIRANPRSSCEALLGNEVFLHGLAQKQLLRNVLVTCESLARLGLSCDLHADFRSNSAQLINLKNNLRSSLDTIIATQDTSIREEIVRDLTQVIHDISIGGASFLSYAGALPPVRNPLVKVQVHQTATDTSLTLVIPIDWSSFTSPDREKINEIVSSFWERSVKHEERVFRLQVRMVDIQEGSDGYRIVLGPMDGRGSVSHRARTISMGRSILEEPETEKSRYVWSHEIGHVLGYPEHYGYFIRENACGFGDLSPTDDIMANAVDYAALVSMSPQNALDLLNAYYLKDTGTGLTTLATSVYELMEASMAAESYLATLDR